MNREIYKLFSTFFKIGAFTFGGGWAMIAMMEKDIVNKHGQLAADRGFNEECKQLINQ